MWLKTCTTRCWVTVIRHFQIYIFSSSACFLAEEQRYLEDAVQLGILKIWRYPQTSLIARHLRRSIYTLFVVLPKTIPIQNGKTEICYHNVADQSYSIGVYYKYSAEGSTINMHFNWVQHNSLGSHTKSWADDEAEADFFEEMLMWAFLNLAVFSPTLLSMPMRVNSPASI